MNSIQYISLKKTLTVLFLYGLFGFAQTKSTPNISFNTDMTAKLTLNNDNSSITLVLTGTETNWSSVSIGTATSKTAGDVYAYNASVLNNTGAVPTNPAAWTIVSNTTDQGLRTVTLERILTNTDLNDFQFDYNTTNSVDIVWSRSGIATRPEPAANRGDLTAIFSQNLDFEDNSFYNQVTLYPNPASSYISVKTANKLSKISIYNQNGSFIKTVSVTNASPEIKIDTSDLSKGLYIFELQNNLEKTWKKVLIN
jgi:hypothetical protein